jgi:hypothetical protein
MVVIFAPLNSMNGGVAQMVEQAAHIRLVGGPSPFAAMIRLKQKALHLLRFEGLFYLHKNLY